MNKTPSLPMTGYIKALDSIRAIAVLMVLVSHSGLIWYLPLPISIRKYIAHVSWGHLGVILFFVLSGFLITRILIKNKGKHHAYRNFLARRSLRIFPIYFLLILILLIFDPGRYLLYCATYTSNYAFATHKIPNSMSHTWSLSVEEHFYLIWPPIVLFLSLKISKAWVFFVFPAASILGSFFIFQSNPDPVDYFYRATHVQIFALSLGSVLAYHESWLRKNWRTSLLVATILAICTLILFILLNDIFHADPIIAKFFGFSLLSSSILCALLAINDAQQFLYRIATHSVLLFIGRISYGIYLYHFPIFYYTGVFPAKDPSFIMIVSSSLTAILVSAMSFYLIEKPILNLKKIFSNSK